MLIERERKGKRFVFGKEKGNRVTWGNRTTQHKQKQCMVQFFFTQQPPMTMATMLDFTGPPAQVALSLSFSLSFYGCFLSLWMRKVWQSVHAQHQKMQCNQYGTILFFLNCTIGL